MKKRMIAWLLCACMTFTAAPEILLADVAAKGQQTQEEILSENNSVKIQTGEQENESGQKDDKSAGTEQTETETDRSEEETKNSERLTEEKEELENQEQTEITEETEITESEQTEETESAETELTEETDVVEESEVLESIIEGTSETEEETEKIFLDSNQLEGMGTEKDPYCIYTAEDFDFVRLNNDAGIYYKLMEDIDLDSISWETLWTKNTDEEAFGAHFDGNGHKLYNLIFDS